jgi:hypothetical protein
MTDGTTMDHNTSMMTGAMDRNMSMTDGAMMMKKSTASVAASMGYTWSKDRKTLASKAGIVGYRGTAKQNMVIRTYLVSMMRDGGSMMTSDTMTR